MTAIAWLLLAAMLVLDTASHLLLKASSARAHADPREMHFIRRLFRIPVFWVAIASFLGMMVVWIGFYSVVGLARGVMMGCITIAGVMIGGRLFFNERITPKRALAAVLIGAGVVLVGWERG
jgi:drug/metabolite transporter (DMT)-like permease